MVNLSSYVSDEPIVKRAKFETLNIKDAVHEFKIPFLKINENAMAPFRGSEFAAGAVFILQKIVLYLKKVNILFQQQLKLPFQKELMVDFKKITEDAQEATYGTLSAAGADIYSYDETNVPAGGKALISTDNIGYIKLSVKPGHYGRIAPRSGLIGGDEEIKVLLFNYGDTDFQVKKGDRIAQIVSERTNTEIKEVKHLSETKRGTAGFGSTGIDSITTPSETTVPSAA
uniref:Deoxyuridine 5'-triphosphate nucleotidohydrolase n=1 Tax=Panagrolaimus sp. PS1159 TaxID=55785 RepID=A0AC35F0N4_9BILA